MRMIKRTSIVGAALVGLFAGPAHAEGRLEANIPFSFVMRGHEFPAGHYEISSDEPGVTLVRGTDNRKASYALTNPADDRDPIGSQPALVFTRYENTYRLSEIWMSGSEGSALELSTSQPRATRRAGVPAAPADVEAYVVGASLMP